MRSWLPSFAILLAALVLTYWSTFTTVYGLSDDFAYVHMHEHEGFTAHQFSAGRPLAYPFLLAFGEAGTPIANFGWFRAIGVVFLALFGTMLAHALVRAGWSRVVALALSFAVCCLPAMQVAISWTVMYYVPLAWCAAALAATCAIRAARPDQNPVRWIVAGGVALGASLALYHPAAMALWVFLAIWLFPHRGTAPPVLHIVPFFAIAAVGLTIGYVTLKLGRASFSGHYLGARAGFVMPWVKLGWLFGDEPLRRAARLFIIRPAASGFDPWLVGPGILAAVGLVRFFRRPGALLVAIALVPLTMLPNLMVKEVSVPFRTLGALSALLMVFAALGIDWITRPLGSRRGPVVALLFIAVAGVGAYRASADTRDLIARPHHAEYAYLRRELGRHDLRRVRRIHVLPARWNDFPTDVHQHEYGVPTSALTFQGQAMVYCVARELEPNHLPPEIRMLSTRPSLSVLRRFTPPTDVYVNLRRIASKPLP